MRKAIVLAILLISLGASVFGQREKNRININAGPSWHGTGDLGGFSLSLMHEYDFSRRFGISNGLTTTMHYGKDRTSSPLSSGASPGDRLMRFAIAGIQLTSFGQYHMVAKQDIRLSFHAGPLLRFQSSSYPSVYGFSQDPNTYPEPFYVIYEYDRPNSLTVGYNAGLTLRTRVAPKYFGGVRVGFQNDTNSDVITSISLLFERVFTEIR